MKNDQQVRTAVWRSRWAAIGAAVAVTLGAGGLISVGAASPDSMFVAIDPVRVLDTRDDIGLSGRFADGQNRLLDVTGTIPVVLASGVEGTGAPVPNGATAVVANVTAVFPTSAGFVSVRPGTATGEPTTSNLNFTTGGVVVPNSVTVALPTSGPRAGELSLFFRGTGPTATTDLLVDVVGYYRKISLADLQKQIDAISASTATVPSGATVTGVEIHDTSVVKTTASDDFTVRLPARAVGELTNGQVNFAPGTGTSDGDATCTGTFAAPTAPVGKVCIYVRLGAQVNVEGLEGLALPALADTGFRIRFFTPAAATAGADQYVQVSWAYRAP
jgi:hypothetical protein